MRNRYVARQNFAGLHAWDNRRIPPGAFKKASFLPVLPRRAKTCLSVGKAAASTAVRRYTPHFVRSVPTSHGFWRTKIRLQGFVAHRLIFYVEPLHAARTKLAGLFSILLELRRYSSYSAAISVTWRAAF